MVRMKIIKEKQSKRREGRAGRASDPLNDPNAVPTLGTIEIERITAFQFGINSFALVQNAEGQ